MSDDYSAPIRNSSAEVSDQETIKQIETMELKPTI